MTTTPIPTIPDPMQMWRSALDQFERGVNSFSTRNMESEEFSQAINQFSQVSLGMQHVYSQALASAFKRLDMPSRTELAALAAAVQRVEDRLDILLPKASGASTAPRPARTRRPPEDSTHAPAAIAPTPLNPAVKRARKEAKR